jgi:hypothetical protein
MSLSGKMQGMLFGLGSAATTNAIAAAKIAPTTMSLLAFGHRHAPSTGWMIPRLALFKRSVIHPAGG